MMGQCRQALFHALIALLAADLNGLNGNDLNGLNGHGVTDLRRCCSLFSSPVHTPFAPPHKMSLASSMFRSSTNICAAGRQQQLLRVPSAHVTAGRRRSVVLASSQGSGAGSPTPRTTLAGQPLDTERLSGKKVVVAGATGGVGR